MAPSLVRLLVVAAVVSALAMTADGASPAQHHRSVRDDVASVMHKNIAAAFAACQRIPVSPSVPAVQRSRTFAMDAWVEELVLTKQQDRWPVVIGLL